MHARARARACVPRAGLATWSDALVECMSYDSMMSDVIKFMTIITVIRMSEMK
jgi:hypothetical protein